MTNIKEYFEILMKTLKQTHLQIQSN